MVGCGSLVGERTRFSGDRPTCFCDNRLPILHGSLLVEGKRDHLEEGKQDEVENGSVSDGKLEDRQR